MDLVQLRALVAVVEHGGVAAAAEALHVTQSTITKRLQALEARAGQRLMDRIGRRLRLTEAGRAVLPRARRLLADARETEQLIRGLSDPAAPLSGELRIATSHHIGLHRLPPVLRGFVAAHPQVDLHIDFVDSEDGCRAVDTGAIELAIVTLPAKPGRWPALTLRPVWDDPLQLVGGIDHPLAAQAAVTPADLAAHPAVMPDARTFTHRLVADALARAGVDLRVRMQTNYLETIKMLVATGVGWSALPASMVDASLTALNIDLQIRRSLGVVTHRQRTLSRAANALLHELTDVAAHR